MTRLPLALCLALLMSGPARAGEDLEKKANHILEEATRLEVLHHDSVRHKREVRFRLVREGMPDVEGVLVVKVDSPNLWREDIDFDNYHFQQIRSKDHTWTKSTHDFLPLVVQELWAALDLPALRMRSQDTVKRIYEREIDGIRAECIAYELAHGEDKFDDEACVQKDTGYLMYARHDATTVNFSEFLPAGGIVLPRHIMIELAGKSEIVAEVSEEMVQRFDPAEFVPPDGAEMSEVCSQGSDPIPLSKPDPVSSLIASLGIAHGRVTGVLKVDAEGNVVNAAVVQSLSPIPDELALATVRKWKYAPATCNGKPVKAVTQFSMSY